MLSQRCNFLHCKTIAIFAPPHFAVNLFAAKLGRNLIFVFPNNEMVEISESTKAHLQESGISDLKGLVPYEIFSWENLTSPVTLILLCVGGFLVGFGTRYAGGCTSGHAITGLSSFQLPSLLAVIGFFIGGIIATWFIIPLIF